MVVESAVNETRSRVVPFWMALPSQSIVFKPDTRLRPGVSANNHTIRMAMEIPRGIGREEAKARKRIIRDYFAKWIAEHPDKKVWNASLKSYIVVKYQSINETMGQASISFESTAAVFLLSEVLAKAVVAKRNAAKKNDKNQRPYDYMIFLYYKGIRMLVGHQKSTDEHVLYCITAKK